MLIVLFLVSHFNFLFVPCGGLSWLPVSFLLHVKYTVSYRIVSYGNLATNVSRFTGLLLHCGSHLFYYLDGSHSEELRVKVVSKLNSGWLAVLS